jgi:PKHD-type hydroxylase
MILENDYFFFKSALTDDQCDEIIMRGERQMKAAQERGESIDATTFGRNDKAGLIEAGADETELTAQGAMTNQQLKKKGLLRADKDKKDTTFIRDTHISWMNDPDIYSWLHPFLQRANHDAGWNFDWNWSESLQFTKYGKHQFYGWHPDAGAKPNPPFWDVRNPPKGYEYIEKVENGETVRYPKDNGDGKKHSEKWIFNPNYAGKIRKLSMTVNLTDPKNYKGGNLKFDFGPHAARGRYHTCTEIRPRGSVIVFPSDRYHQVTPITSGTRYSLVMWTLGAPWK